MVNRLLEVKADPVHTGGGPDCGPLDALPFMSFGEKMLDLLHLPSQILDFEEKMETSLNHRTLGIFYGHYTKYTGFSAQNHPKPSKTTIQPTHIDVQWFDSMEDYAGHDDLALTDDQTHGFSYNLFP